MADRDYQLMAAQSIWDYFGNGKTGNPLILMPTGTGKSHVIEIFCRSVLQAFPTQRIQVLTHVQELIEQNYGKLIAKWPSAPAGIYSAGLGRRDIHRQIVFGGIGSVAKKSHAFGHVDLIIIDEADLVSPNDETLYKKYIAALKVVNPHLKVIGLTATGFRLGHGKITEGEGALFTDVCFDMTGVQAFNWLIEEGYLVPLIPRPTRLQLDVNGVHMRGGEFIQAELQNAVDKADITKKAIAEAIEIGHDRNAWLIFASGVEHAVHIAEIATAMGVRTGVVSSKDCYTVDPKGLLVKCTRERALYDFKRSWLRGMANNNVLTTGFDFPMIDLILMLRPTASTRLWVQMLGRGTRPVWPDNENKLNYGLWPENIDPAGFDVSVKEHRLACIQLGPKQNCMVLDYAGNTRKLGPINDPVMPGKKGKGGGEAPIKTCESCDTYNHASARFCCYCGEEFLFAIKIKQEASTEAIIKSDMPKVEIVKVDQITYQELAKAGKPKMMRVTYYSGLKRVTEVVCFEHMGFARKRAIDWWRERSDLPAPQSVSEALQSAEHLRRPSHLSVWVNKPYPEILKIDFSGTGFNTTEEIPESAYPTGEVYGIKPGVPAFDMSDDDIPF